MLNFYELMEIIELRLLSNWSVCSEFLAELGSEADLPPLKVTSVLNSPLWKPVFRHQMCPEAEPGASETSRGHHDKKEVLRSLLLFYWLEIFRCHTASSQLEQECMGY